MVEKLESYTRVDVVWDTSSQQHQAISEGKGSVEKLLRTISWLENGELQYFIDL